MVMALLWDQLCLLAMLANAGHKVNPEIRSLARQWVSTLTYRNFCHKATPMDMGLQPDSHPIELIR